jgi:predicted aspartyl protease
MSKLRHASVFLALGVLVALLAACSLPRIATAPAATPTQGITEHVTISRDSSGATLVLLPVTIEGHGPFTFALDTGASTSLIDTSLAQQLDLPEQDGIHQISGIGGVQEATSVEVQDWHIGQIRLPKAIIASADLPGERRRGGLEGLVGSDIWSQFGTFTLDYSTGTLTVPKQIADTPAQFPALAESLPSRSLRWSV